MKNVCITYCMKRKGEVAETCIVLPMKDEIADELLARQDKCWQLADGATLNVLLHKLALIQGYQFAALETAEAAEAPLSEY